MNTYRLLEHTADMGVEARAETLPELFRQMALGLRQIMTECADIRPQLSLLVEVSGEDREELLVNWLGELVYLLESRSFLPATIEIDELGDTLLRARVRGERVDPERHHLEREIKAVTYHQIRVESGADGWSAQVYVDL
ncbi:MAG: protein archease [Desulfuromonas sp.]|nr:MAG: protein archease [Desulfuromonas sp.]